MKRKSIISLGLLITFMFVSSYVALSDAKYEIYRILPVKLRWEISYFLADKFLVGIVYFVEKDDTLLLVKHNYQNKWGLPGGWLEHGESIESSIRREMKEELGAIVKNVKTLEIRKVPSTQVIDVVLKCEIENDSLQAEDGEISSFNFFSKDSLPDDILHTHKPYIAKYLTSSDYVNH